MAKLSSATALAPGPGMRMKRSPRRRRASRSTLSKPEPARITTCRSVPASITRDVICTPLRNTSAWQPAMASHRLSSSPPKRTTGSCITDIASTISGSTLLASSTFISDSRSFRS